MPTTRRPRKAPTHTTPTVQITGLKLVKSEDIRPKLSDFKLCGPKASDLRERRKRYFAANLTVNGVSTDMEIFVHNDDGSIHENVGRWYVSAEINKAEKDAANKARMKLEGRARYTLTHGRCPKCQKALSTAVMAVLKPLLEAEGYKLAHWRFSGGFSVFEVHAKILVQSQPTGRAYAAASELAIVQYVQTLDCPFHGRVKDYDNEPLD